MSSSSSLKWLNLYDSETYSLQQSIRISLTLHFYDWHPGSRCGWTCNQLTSKVDGSITGSRIRWSTSYLVCDPTIRQPGFDLPRQQWSLLNRFRTNRDTAVPPERNGDLQTLTCVLAARLRWCPTLSNPVLWQSSHKAEWQLIPDALCRWRCCLVRILADQLRFMTCIREKEVQQNRLIGYTKLSKQLLQP